MNRKLLCAFFCAALAFAPGFASARLGTEIGVFVPTGGRASKGASESYASFTAGKIIEELRVSKKSGSLAMELRVTNDGDTPYTIEHPDGQEYDFALLDKNGKAVWRASDGAESVQTPKTSAIAPHGSEIYRAEIGRKELKKLKGAVLVVAFLKDTPYTISTAVPESSSPGSAVHGAIIIGNGGRYDPW